MAYYNISYKGHILYGIRIKFLHKQMVHRLLLACILEIPGLNPGQVIGHPEFFHAVLHSSRRMLG